MAVKIKKISIQNFKGIKELTITPKSKSLNIYGDNGTGKTTIYDAWLWLLFDKDSNNRSDFEIKPLQKSGEPIHNIETSVEAELDIDGKTYTFKKTLSENWSKKRGQLDLTFSGHKLGYYINGTPKRRTDYINAIRSIIDENVFKILSSVTYFNEFIDWKERRSILLKLCTNKSDLEIAQENPQFAELIEPLSNQTIDDYMSYLKATRKKINQEMKDIPVRVDELSKRLPEEAEDNLQTLKEQLDNLKKERSSLLDGNNTKTRIEELNKIIQEKLNDKNSRKTKLMLELINEDMIKNEIEGIRTQKERKEKEIEDLRKQWYEVRDLKPDVEDKCPCCGQYLPEEKIQSAIEEFNKKKANTLESITASGKELRKTLDIFIEEEKKLLKELKEAQEKNKIINQKIQEIDNEPIPEMEEIENVNDSDLNDKINALDKQISEIESKIVEIEGKREIVNRIKELENREKELAVEFAKNEESIKLVEKFIVHKINMIEESINKQFRIARFKLFNQLINGGIEETCETTVDGIPYRNLNNGTRINVGLDIIKTLQKFYNANIPIFIDNAESVNDLVDMGNTQIIRLVVSKDKELKFEEV